MSEDAGCGALSIRATCRGCETISDLRLLISGLCPLLLALSLVRISRVGVFADRESPSLREYERAARALNVSLESLEVNHPNPDLEALFRSAAKARVNAIIMTGSRSINRYAKQIVELALKNRLPSMFEISTRVEAGGLMSYSADDAALFRRAAVYVDKILKGTKPADLPVEQPTKFEFVINLKTAKALNLTIPQSVLFRADRVIK